MPANDANYSYHKSYRTCLTNHMGSISCHITLLVKTSGSESRGQEEAACVHHQAYATTTVSYYTDESSNFLNAVAQPLLRLSLSLLQT